MVENAGNRKVIILAHCVLNQNARVMGLAYRKAIVEEIVDFLIRQNVGIVQLPCPEVLAEGLGRKSQTKCQYDTPRFRRLCRQIARSTAKVIQEYLHNGAKVITVLGIEGSPSCAVEEPSGILMEELKQELSKRRISLPFYELNLKALDHDLGWLKEMIKSR